MDNNTSNTELFGTENYDRVQTTYENWTWKRGYYVSVFDEMRKEELDRREMEAENTPD
jgi:hypothetical protein